MLAAILAGLKALGAMFGLGEKLAEAKARAKTEEAGENRILARHNAEAAKVNSNVAEAALSTDADTVDRLRKHGF